MDYLNLLKLQNQHKIALIVDAKAYTYADLVMQAEAIRKRYLAACSSKTRHAVFIHQNSIAEQLVEFLAYSGTTAVPVIAAKVSRGQQFNPQNIAQEACMGVMTSGSTGKAKLLWRSYQSWASFFAEQNRVFGIDAASKIFCQGSLAFTGNLNLYLGVFAANGAIIASDNFRPKQWIKLMNEHHANGMYLIPTKLLLLTKTAQEPNDFIKTIVSGSQSLGKNEAAKIKRIYPQAQLTLYYGASELNYITYIKDTEMTSDRSIVGKPFNNVSVAVQNEEIFVDTPYGVENIQMPYSLKDRGYIDTCGNLHFLGRSDDICNVNGIKVSGYKVETVVSEIFHADEAAILNFHHNDVDFLVAFIAGARQTVKNTLRRSLRLYLTEFELPKQFIYMKQLPKNESGKVDRRQLHAVYAARLLKGKVENTQ